MSQTPTPKPEASSAPAVLPWHPNFRNYERLPDIKAVRTTFFVNLVAVSATLLVSAWVGFGEYHLAGIADQNAQAQAQVDRDRKASDQNILLYKQFQAEEKRITEITTFTKSRHQVSPLLLHLGASLPKYIALNYFEFRGAIDKGEKLLIIRGVVTGSADSATTRISAYESLLKKDPIVSSYTESVTLTSATRSSTDDKLSFELQAKLKAPAK